MTVSYDSVTWYEDGYEDESGEKYECSITAGTLSIDSPIDLTLSLESPLDLTLSLESLIEVT